MLKLVKLFGLKFLKLHLQDIKIMLSIRFSINVV